MAAHRAPAVVPLSIGLGLGVALLSGLVPASPPGAAPAGSLRPAMLVWAVGLDQREGPSRLVETITAATWSGRPVWRVTHTPQDPSASKTRDFDLYDLDRDTLAPLRSVSTHDDGTLALEFNRERVVVRKSGTGGGDVEEVELHGPVEPEGPGLTPFVATLPLSDGYLRRYDMVDRWDGRGSARLKRITLRATRRGDTTSALGRNAIFEVAIQPEDSGFRIVEEVLAKGLHWPVRMTYTRGALTLKSEVLSIASSP